jgi:hypothetical protein
MNENKINTEILQFMLTYYRNKCSQLEYEFLLFKASVDIQTRTTQPIANGGSDSKGPENTTAKKGKSNGQGN